MDPIDPFFNSEAWIQEYAARQERQRAGQQSGNASQQGGFEQQMESLQLSSPDRSSASSASPDESPAERTAQHQHAGLGGSMRMPPYPQLRDELFSSARHSVDVPRPRAGSAAQLPRSNLRDNEFSSARYTLPDAEPAIQSKSSKGRELWSRIKSGVGKAFGGGRSEGSSGATMQQEAVSTFRVDYARQPGRARGGPVPAADEALIQDFRNKAGGNLSDGTIKNAAADLRHLSARLSMNGRPSIADRIRRELENAQLENPEVDNHQLEAELDQDVDSYANDRGRRIKAALKKLREVGAGRALSADVRRLNPYPADATLIDMWAAAEKATHRIEPKTVDRQARRLYRLSEWLQARNLGPIAGRLFTDGLSGDVEDYKRETQDTKIGPDLVRLGQYQQVLDANRALGLPPAEGAPPFAREGAQRSAPRELPATPVTPSAGAWNWLGEQIHGPSSSSSTPQRGPQGSLSQGLPATPATPSAGAWDWLSEQIHGSTSALPAPPRDRQPSLSHGLPATPATPSTGAWDWPGQQMHEAASPSSVRRPSSDIYGSLDQLVNLDPPTPYELRDDAQSVPAPRFAGPPSVAGPSGTPQELRDIGTIVGEDWQHGSQPASDVLIDVLGNINLLPNQYEPSQFAINGERYSATFGPGGRSDVHLIHHPRTRQINQEAGPSRQLYQPPQVSDAGPSRGGVVDLGYLIHGGWQHRERYLPSFLVSALEGQHLMPDAENPTYFNIRGVPYRGELEETGGRRRVRIRPEPG